MFIPQLESLESRELPSHAAPVSVQATPAQQAQVQTLELLAFASLLAAPSASGGQGAAGTAVYADLLFLLWADSLAQPQQTGGHHGGK